MAEVNAQRRRDAVAGDLSSLDTVELLQWTTWDEMPS